MTATHSPLTPQPLLAILNRGEIVGRVARSAKKLGFKILTIHSPSDQDSSHLDFGDFKVSLLQFHKKQVASLQSPQAYMAQTEQVSDVELYLNESLLTELCIFYNVDYVHPGYGFLSESASFARSIRETGIKWVGPLPETMESIGLKNRARAFAQALGVPCVQGFSQPNASNEDLQKAAQQIRPPMLIKAASGGGGRGMRLVKKIEDITVQIQSARRESLLAFGNDDLLIEQYIPKAKHIEIQIFGDEHQQQVHLGERDCTVQRRHQKLIEEAPAVCLSPQKAQELYDDALKIAKALNYQSAGTVEFLLSETGEHYFLEVNTRIQVEHGVSELLYDVDLVEWQLKVAQGEALPLNQNEINARRGQTHPYVIELRLCAESPDQDCKPQSGRIIAWRSHKDAQRLDHCIGNHISPFFDSMVAKLIYTGEERLTAIKKAAYSVQNTCLLGVQHNASLLHSILTSKSFINHHHYTQWLSHFLNKAKDSISELATVNDEQAIDPLDQAIACLLLTVPSSLFQAKTNINSIKIWASSDVCSFSNEVLANYSEFSKQSPSWLNVNVTVKHEDEQNSFRLEQESLPHELLRKNLNKELEVDHNDLSSNRLTTQIILKAHFNDDFSIIDWQDQYGTRHQREVIFVLGDQEEPFSLADFQKSQEKAFFQLWDQAILNAYKPPRMYLRTKHGYWHLFTKMSGLCEQERKSWLNSLDYDQQQESNYLEMIDQDYAYVLAPLGAKVQSINVEVNQVVSEQSSLITLESMKLEYQVSAPQDLLIEKYFVQVGQLLKRGDRLALVRYS